MNSSVIDDRIVTPSSIVYLVVKVRLVSPINGSAQTFSFEAKNNEKRDYAFLSSRKDAEDVSPQIPVSGIAHAPHWPAVRVTRLLT